MSRQVDWMLALHVNCIFHQLRGDGAILEQRAAELVALATEQGFPHFVGSGTCFRAWAKLAMGGSIEEAISRMRWGLATKRATGAEIKVPYDLGLLAEAHRRANRIADGMSLLNEALELVERADERRYEAELCRLMAEALITNSDRHDAERWLLPIFTWRGRQRRSEPAVGFLFRLVGAYRSSLWQSTQDR